MKALVDAQIDNACPAESLRQPRSDLSGRLRLVVSVFNAFILFWHTLTRGKIPKSDGLRMNASYQ